MTWTTPADLRAQVLKLWDKGLLPSSLIGGAELFPRRLTLKGPSSAELANRFDEVRGWMSGLREAPHYRVVVRELRHRVIGSNAIPSEIWVDRPDDALTLIGKQREARKLRDLAELTRNRQPILVPWLSKHALRALELAGDWPYLLDITAWIQTHPRPGIYLRQIDLPGVHSKFIETHRGVLSELLDIVLPADAVDETAIGAGLFCRRYGFLEKPTRIRFRILDPSRTLLPMSVDQDVTLNSEAFAQLNPPARRVFITENETNFLAFPSMPESMVIFGAGYGFEMLAKADWLRQREIHYWGDIDTHGFAILDQLRGYHPHAQSFLMDRETLMAHQSLWVNEAKPERRDLPRLTPEEHALFDDLRDNRIGTHVRLEQERLDFGWFRAILEGMS